MSAVFELRNTWVPHRDACREQCAQLVSRETPHARSSPPPFLRVPRVSGPPGAFPDQSGRADLYAGEVHFELHRNPAGFPTKIVVLRADPRIRVTSAFMQQARAGVNPAMKTTVHGDTELLTVAASNGTWVYVVAHYDPALDVFCCHWPD